MELKKLSDLFWSISPNLYYLAILLSIISGLFYALLVPFIMYATDFVTPDGNQLVVNNYSYFNSPTSTLAILFLLTCVGVIAVKSVSELLTNYIGNRALTWHRIEFYKRIENLSQIELERIGHSRLISLMNVDIPVMVNAALVLPIIWADSITVVGVLTYLIYLNVNVFLFVLACLTVAIFTVQVPMTLCARFLRRSREQNDRFQEGARGLILGSKELKLDREKTLKYFQEELFYPERLALDYKLKGNALSIAAQNYGGIISFLVISIVIFHLPYKFPLTTMDLFGIVVALVYLTGPIGAMLTSMRQLPQGKVALNKVREFYSLALNSTSMTDSDNAIDCSSFRFREISFQYPNRQNEFALKNISAEFRRGQISFIVGGNGSGKSTFSKIISLHYRPDSGEIVFGKDLLDEYNIGSARRNIAAIYSDFYLFPSLYKNYDRKQMDEYLNLLSLSGKVNIENGRFSTTKLSDGQKKRLALLTLLLEDRSICIFDEWAADQDPEFKEVFYLTVLPLLREKGKIVIVITHDDRYFGCADQLISMDQGKIREIRSNHLHSEEPHFAI